jgi:Ca2+:H+ antiporter
LLVARAEGVLWRASDAAKHAPCPRYLQTGLSASHSFDMVARMSVETQRNAKTKSAPYFGSVIKHEFALAIALGTAAIFFATGSQLVEIVAHPVALIVVFIWLFVIILWSAICVVRHADCLASKLGEPYGTLILTLSAISIEVVMISTAMLHGANNPTLGRDAIFSVIMIALNGLVGLCLLLGGLRYREQHYNLQGVNAYLNVIMSLAVLGLVLPNFTTSTGGPTFSFEQAIFLAVVSLLLYGTFLFIQTMRHRRYFVDSSEDAAATKSGHHSLQTRSTSFHATMLLLYLVAVILLSKKFAIPLDNSIERFGMPQEFGGAIIAALVLSPEGFSAIEASMRNQLQRSINLLFGSVLATIGLTIPSVVTIGLVTHRPVTLGVPGGNLPLLLLTLAVSVVTFTSRRTNVLQGCVHLLLFAVFVLLIFAP